MSTWIHGRPILFGYLCAVSHLAFVLSVIAISR